MRGWDTAFKRTKKINEKKVADCCHDIQQNDTKLTNT